MATFPQYVCSVLTRLLMFQLKSNPSQKEEREAQNQLRKSDEIQRLLAQAHDSYNSRDCGTAASLLDAVIEVSRHGAAVLQVPSVSPPPRGASVLSAVHRPAFGTWPLVR